jgi:hypothetical protein
VHITTKVLGSNSVHSEVYWIQQYVIKFVSDLLQVGGFLWVLRFSPPIRLPRYNWNIVESGVKHHKPTKPTELQKVIWSWSNLKVCMNPNWYTCGIHRFHLCNCKGLSWIIIAVHMSSTWTVHYYCYKHILCEKSRIRSPVESNQI